MGPSLSNAPPHGSFTVHEHLRLRRPDRDLCHDCHGWGFQPGTTGGNRPKCPRCRGLGGQEPHDLDCPTWGLHSAR